MKQEYDSITLNGQEISVRNAILEQSSLSYYPANPRIYSLVNRDCPNPSQEEIEAKLLDMDHVKRLSQTISANGGLIDPLLVRDEDHVVVEGNSRLAAIRILARRDPIRWAKVKCKILPFKLDEKLIFKLLCEYHIVGRKDWVPYEQAGLLWRRKNEQNVSPAEMARELGVSSNEITRLIDVYEFMQKHGDMDLQHWSYYDEYLKSNKIAKRRSEYPELDEVIVAKIACGEIEKAVDIRDKVKKIAAVGGKTLNKFLTTRESLEDCYERAILRGADNAWLNRLKKFREHLNDPDLRKYVNEMPKNQTDRCKYELEKIRSRVDWLLRQLK